MPVYEVECSGTSREVWRVEAENETQARLNWPDGHLVVAETQHEQIVRVVEIEE